MSAITCVRRLTFSAGHRVAGHENRCRNLHGHCWVVEVEAQRAEELDWLGRVIDFGALKERVGSWIDANWDHAFIVGADDGEAIAALKMVAGQRTFLLPYNPTAENLARFLLEVVGPAVLDGAGVKLVRVVVHETENCRASASL